MMKHLFNALRGLSTITLSNLEIGYIVGYLDATDNNSTQSNSTNTVNICQYIDNFNINMSRHKGLLCGCHYDQHILHFVHEKRRPTTVLKEEQRGTDDGNTFSLDLAVTIGHVRSLNLRIYVRLSTSYFRNDIWQQEKNQKMKWNVGNRPPICVHFPTPTVALFNKVIRYTKSPFNH